jgi:TonB family protein
MRLASLLLFVAAVLVVETPLLAAQQRLPDSYQARLATLDSLKNLTRSDISELTIKAQSGVPNAQYLLALIYDDGRVVPRDMAASTRWMLKAAVQGYVPAEVGMGKTYLVNARTGPVPNYADADKWLRMASMQGDAEAQFLLGDGYERGLFGAIDYREALKWLRKASAQGLPDAQYSLGGMYEAGEGVSESDEMAAYWYREAADHFAGMSGVWLAEIQLDYMYRDSRLKRDYEEAYMWAAIVGSSVDPIDDTDLKRAAEHMTKAQIAEAQRRTEHWVSLHTRQPKNLYPLRSAAQEYGDGPKPSPTSRLHMIEALSEGHLVDKVEPEYPSAAKASKVEGDVIFRIIIGKDGIVKEIHLRRGNPMLIEDAAKALSKWRYDAIKLDGKPVEVETFATVRFRLPTTH